MKEQLLKQIIEKQDELIHHLFVTGEYCQICEALNNELSLLKSQLEEEEKKGKYFDEDGEIYAGVHVICEGKKYVTGNRRYPLVELFHNGKFIKTVNQKDIIVTPTKDENTNLH